jgi:hypothetical protein
MLNFKLKSKKGLEILEKLSEFPDPEKGLSLSKFSYEGLNELREKIKETFLPLLIHVFQLKQAKQEGGSFSNLEQTKTFSEEEISQKLRMLHEDLKQLSIWTTSCLSQIEKALDTRESHSSLSSLRAKKNFLSSPRLLFSKLFSPPPSSDSEKSQDILKRLAPKRK